MILAAGVSPGATGQRRETRLLAAAAGPLQGRATGRPPSRSWTDRSRWIGPRAPRWGRRSSRSRGRNSARPERVSRGAYLWIVVDPDGLREAGQTLDSPVKAPPKAAPPAGRCPMRSLLGHSRKQLRIMLEPLGLAAEVKDGAIVITSRGRVDERSTSPVQDDEKNEHRRERPHPRRGSRHAPGEIPRADSAEHVSPPSRWLPRLLSQPLRSSNPRSQTPGCDCGLQELSDRGDLRRPRSAHRPDL